MTGRIDMDSVQSFSVGTEGEPGNRTFFFQARGEIDGRIGTVSFKCEKVQAALLAEAMGKLLGDFPLIATGSIQPWEPLMTPVFPEWTVGTIQLGYEQSEDRVIVFLQEVVEIDEGVDPESIDLETVDVGRARFQLSREQASAIVANVPMLLAAGRPLCPLCGSTVTLAGYTCSCFN
jgi:uncharacterized repeat protein (TIGR03847 family)